MSVDITIQETINEVDITVNQNVITVNVTRTTGGGGGGVESVTGDLVNNTDPLNPIVEVPSLTQVLTVGDKALDSISGDRTWQPADRLKYWQVQSGIQTLDDTVFPDGSLIEGVIQNDDINATVTFDFDGANCFYLDQNITTLTLNVGDFFQLKHFSGVDWFLTVANKGSGGVTSVNGDTGDVVLTTDNVAEGSTNLYFTVARVRATILTGISFVSGAVITATDTVLSALGKLQKQISSLGAVAFSNNYNDLDNKPTIPSPQNLTQVLAIDNKTNDIPIVSNNGKAAVDVNDAYTSLSYETQVFAMGDTGVQLYSEVPVTFDSTVSTDFNTPVLNYNSEEVATQNWVTSQGYGTGTGTVNSVAVSTANGFAGSSSGGADPSLTISTTATGVLKGNGTAISAATAETDYTTPTGAGALTNKTMSGVTNTFTNIPQSAVTNLTTDLANKQDKGNYRKLVAVDAGNTTHTGTLTETIVSSILIPANSLDALCDLFFSYDYEKSTGNFTTIKVYKNTTNSLTGATLFASYSAGSFRNAGFFRKMLLRGTNLDTQASTATLLNNYIGDILFASSNVITLNPAVNNYILVTITLSNTGDVFTTKRTILEKLNLVP